MMQRTRFGLDGKAALVTGGASGIGAALVRAFVEPGARVVIGHVDGVRSRKPSERTVTDSGDVIGGGLTAR